MADNKPISSFCVDRKMLTDDELWKLLMFCSTAENLNSERWEIEIISKYHWINGCAQGEDTGKFWEFLVANKLNDKVEIIRG